MHCRISVITVVLNAVKTMERTIKSVIRQGYDNIEYIVIDGGSTDGTLDIVKKYESIISYWSSEPDKGIYDAMNKGLRIATGDYIIFLNSDDWFTWDAFKIAVSYLEESDADVLYGDVIYIGTDGRRTSAYPYPLDSFHWRMPFCHQAAFMRNARKKYFDTKYKIAADYKAMYEIYLEGGRFVYIPHAFANFSLTGISRDCYTRDREVLDIASEELVRYPDELTVYRQCIIRNFVRKENKRQFDAGENHMQIYEFIKMQIGGSNVIIFGTGCILDRFWNFIQKVDQRILYFVDNDETKWGGKKFGHCIRSPQSLLEERNVAVYIMTDRYVDEIVEQIDEMNLDSTVRVYCYPELVQKYDNYMASEIIEANVQAVASFRRLMDIK